ncbi:MAG: histidinol dehydrogenase [Candidatus Bathyarchaeia archaeon]
MKIFIRPPAELLEGRRPGKVVENEELVSYIKPIIADVRDRGDDAILEYTRRFDEVSLKAEELRVSEEEIKKAYDTLSDGETQALECSKERLKLVEEERLDRLQFDYSLDGIIINNGYRSISSVGCYVPGGKASYPSSLIMNVVPARVAGVSRVAVCSPPARGGEINPLTLVAADICGVDEVYRMGGAQAIAAMAYGTETIEFMDKIVGPGNVFVTLAKQLVSEHVAVDKPAGPTEILVLADETAEPELVALDMISQAEHGEGGISGLVTTSNKLAERVRARLSEYMENIPKRSVVKKVLSERGFIYITQSMRKGIEFVNLFAPEHVEILTSEDEAIAEQINTAGLVLLGRYTPVSATDYCMGVNHVLPTGGYGRLYGGITVLDYIKPISIVRASKRGLQAVRDSIGILARSEGLPNHALAVEGRFE